MIVLFNPISTSPGKQPLPLSLMSLAAVLERVSDFGLGGMTPTPWTLVDGNVVADPAAEIIARLSAAPRSEVSLLAVRVCDRPQATQSARPV